MANEKPPNNDNAFEEATELPRQGVVIPLEVRCRDCFHFKHQKASGYKSVCIDLGILPQGRPCAKFLPDAKLFDLRLDEGRDLRQYVGTLPANKLALYAALLMQERTTRRQGFRHGEMIYIRLFREDYLSNYARAWVIMANAQRVFVQGVDSRFRGNFLRTSIFDAEEFARKKKALISRKLINDPNLIKYTERRIKTNKAVIDYEPPVIDGVLQLTKKKKSAKKHTGMTVMHMRGRK